MSTIAGTEFCPFQHGWVHSMPQTPALSAFTIFFTDVYWLCCWSLWAFISLLCYRKHQNLATVTDKAKPLRTGKFQLKHDSSIWMHTLRTWLVLLSTRHVEQTFYFSAPQGNWLIDGVPSHSFKPGVFGEDIPFPIQALSRRYIQPSSALPINGPKNKNHKGKQGQFPISTLIF